MRRRAWRSSIVLRGLWRLTWLEIKIFVREPMGVIGTIGIPVALFGMLGRMFGGSATGSAAASTVGADLPILGALLIALNAVLSLVTVIAIYREGGILKRLRATPLRPHVILSAHVMVKLLTTVVTMILTALVGARFYPMHPDLRLLSFGLGLLFVTLTILSVGFLIASVVPTARFAQPIGSLLLYPMVALSGLFFPIASLPAWLQPVCRLLPLTYAVSLLRGLWMGEGWFAHGSDAIALVVVFTVCLALSSKVFRWV
jgi:ABC-2 type transport system permease protein